MPHARRAALLASLLLVVAGVATGSAAWAQPGGRKGGGEGRVSALGGYALPSEIAAASIAWTRLAGDKGWWKAMRETAAPDAQILSDGTTQRVQAFAKGRAEPASLPHRRTHHVWMSCDGSIGVEEGLFEDGAAHGWYTTIWQRQPKKGNYKWVLDQSGIDTGAAADFDFIEGKVADCGARAHGDAPSPPAGGNGTIEVGPVVPGTIPARIAAKGETDAMPDHLIGLSRDHTLNWATRFDADGTRHLTVNLLMGGKRVEVLNRSVAPARTGGA
ncbi:MAG: hypothetical protein KGJ57_09110 [Sphingomonadales bacterium]|nr:hypothetical protein [Sphingomonadales bacterium]MDE2169570.1 hypothetical protein [Sphingomonadales bacterium]